MPAPKYPSEKEYNIIKTLNLNGTVMITGDILDPNGFGITFWYPKKADKL